MRWNEENERNRETAQLLLKWGRQKKRGRQKKKGRQKVSEKEGESLSQTERGERGREKQKKRVMNGVNGWFLNLASEGGERERSKLFSFKTGKKEEQKERKKKRGHISWQLSSKVLLLVATFFVTISISWMWMTTTWYNSVLSLSLSSFTVDTTLFQVKKFLKPECFESEIFPSVFHHFFRKKERREKI